MINVGHQNPESTLPQPWADQMRLAVPRAGLVYTKHANEGKPLINRLPHAQTFAVIGVVGLE
ncbi:hypothetical protein GALL_451850 [mine drainage metagenome]|uniref:Uncharacterized protein n=1 Tax=mine drainage metagenome TaxID=410659 RepID=A0A1J5PNN0_9ZZZZ